MIAFKAKYIALFSFPAWGTFVTVGIASLAHNAKMTGIADLIVFSGVLVIILSVVPIFKIKNFHVVLKIFISIVYLLLSAVVVFFLGWMSLVYFGMD